MVAGLTDPVPRLTPARSTQLQPLKEASENPISAASDFPALASESGIGQSKAGQDCAVPNPAPDPDSTPVLMSPQRGMDLHLASIVLYELVDVSLLPASDVSHRLLALQSQENCNV